MSHQAGRNPFSNHGTSFNQDVFQSSSLFQGNPLYSPQAQDTSGSPVRFIATSSETTQAVEQSVAAIFNEVTDAITQSLKYESWDEADAFSSDDAFSEVDQIKDGQSLR